MVTFQYPLQWLPQQPRTKVTGRARFGKHSTSKAGDYLIADLERLGASKCIISSNMQPRQRGDVEEFKEMQEQYKRCVAGNS